REPRARRRARGRGGLRGRAGRRRGRTERPLRLRRRRRPPRSGGRAPESRRGRRRHRPRVALGGGVIQHPCFSVEGWALHETELRLELLAQTESLFALSNGHIGIRGNLDEGEPHGAPGTYLGGLYELHTLPSAELSYGTPESGQFLVNVTNGKLIRLLVDD